VLYLATSPNQPEVAEALGTHQIGLMSQPASHAPRAGWIWAADNGCFASTWNEDRWLRWLARPHPRSGCLFATVPDVVGDAEATFARWERYAPMVRELRYPLAYVGQDGLDLDLFPTDADAFFVGGSTAWKMSEDAYDFAREARARGMWVHVGRVNSWSRFEAWAPYADSCDGTFLAFGPQTNIVRLLGWVDRHRDNPQLALDAAT